MEIIKKWLFGEPEEEEPYVFIYPSLWRQYKIVAYKNKIGSKHKDWADFRLVPAMTNVPTDHLKSPFLSSDYLPMLHPTLASLPYIGKNSKASIYKYCVQTYKPEEYPAVKKMLKERGWELTSGILPLSPYEIADIERIAHFGMPMWEAKLEEDKKESEKKDTARKNLDYLF